MKLRWSQPCAKIAMLAFVVRNGRLEPRQKALPRIPTGWALVRVRLAGICNTDLELLRGYHNFRGTSGHEFVGEVVRMGAGRSAGAPPMRIKGGKSSESNSQWLGRRVVGEIISPVPRWVAGRGAATASVAFPRIAFTGA